VIKVGIEKLENDKTTDVMILSGQRSLEVRRALFCL